MTAIGFAAAVMPLGTAIALFSTLARLLMIVMLLLLPERAAVPSRASRAKDRKAYPFRQPSVAVSRD
jgi:hypothetical protein